MPTSRAETHAAKQSVSSRCTVNICIQHTISVLIVVIIITIPGMKKPRHKVPPLQLDCNSTKYHTPKTCTMHIKRRQQLHIKAKWSSRQSSVLLYYFTIILLFYNQMQRDNRKKTPKNSNCKQNNC